MTGRASYIGFCCAAIVFAACEGAPPGPPADSPFDAELWAKVLSLSPAELPAPPVDVSNRVADDPLAAALGQRLFFDPGFSGVLLDSDNDMTHGGTGVQGDTGRVSCASCHVAQDGFSDSRTARGQLSLGSGWTQRRSPSILDVGHASLLMWDGRFDSLQRQVLAVFESPVEANSSRLFVAQELARSYADEYIAVFGDDPSDVLDASYPQLTPENTGCVMALGSATTADDACTEGELHGVPGDGAEYDSMGVEQQRRVTQVALNAGKAIAAYERLLSCGSSRFDAYVAGDLEALDEAEVRGAALFVGKAECASCHSGPFLSDQAFHNVGMIPETVSVAFLRDNDPGAEQGLVQVMSDPLGVSSEYSDGNDGRLPMAVPENARGAFRTPMLRCVSQRPSWMHTGQFRQLRDVVEFFSEGGHIARGEPEALGFLGQNEIEPLGLSESEIDDLVAFLVALDGVGPSPELLVSP